jgi:hypothetical protein
MKRLLRWCVAATWLIATSGSYAAFHLFQIEQIYSNADGSVQFIVLVDPGQANNGENQWTGQTITSAGNVYTFASDLPSFLTGGKRALIATQGFANLNIVTPDYIVPNGFLSVGSGTVNYADVDQVTYSALPIDGVSAIQRNGAVVPNVATNFAGKSGSVGAAAGGGGSTAYVPVDGVWANAAESGRGFALGYKHGVLIVAIYAYLPNGQAQWYLASGPVVNNVFTGTLDKYTGGQCVSCAYNGPPTVAGNDGAITITFTSNSSATVNLPGGRVTQIVPFQF